MLKVREEIALPELGVCRTLKGLKDVQIWRANWFRGQMSLRAYGLGNSRSCKTQGFGGPSDFGVGGNFGYMLVCGEGGKKEWAHLGKAQVVVREISRRIPVKNSGLSHFCLLPNHSSLHFAP